MYLERIALSSYLSINCGHVFLTLTELQGKQDRLT